LLGFALTCGILDATAAFNTASFGIGVYIVASGLCGFILILRSKALGDAERDSDGIPSIVLKAALFTIALLWLYAFLQISLQIADPQSLLTQTTVRSILIGHFLVLVLLIRVVDDQDYLQRLLRVVLFIYLSYGIYDLGAQALHLPRFLNFLRNSQSAAITTMVGAQGWIHLPRIMSLASEPSATMLPLALGMFLYARLRGLKRFLLLSMCVVFCIGTFARSVWIAIVGASCLALGFRLLEALWGRSSPRVTASLATAAALVLPMLILYIPFLTRIPANADQSLVERTGSSRASVSIFADHALTGIGFEGWTGRIFGQGDAVNGLSSVGYIHSGVGVYLAALGIAGLLVVYLPILLIMSNRSLSLVAKGWWIGIYCFATLAGDCLALSATWTAIAVAVCWNSNMHLRPHRGRLRHDVPSRAPDPKPATA
jgi:hypothetical protein